MSTSMRNLSTALFLVFVFGFPTVVSAASATANISLTVVAADTCNINIVSGATEAGEASHEACEILVIDDDFTAYDGASVSLSSGENILIMPGFLLEKGATLDVNVCGQSLCEISDNPMPKDCHSCVKKICHDDVDPLCCIAGFDQACLNLVDTLCSLVCE